jgi:hypothetical protein
MKSVLSLVMFLTILSACSPSTVRMIDDVIEGEVKVAENVIDDVGGIPHKP